MIKLKTIIWSEENLKKQMIMQNPSADTLFCHVLI